MGQKGIANDVQNSNSHGREGFLGIEREPVLQFYC